MTTVLVFHHALGLTDGVRSFAHQLQAQGHTVMVPDLYEGRTFASLTLTEDVAYAEAIGMELIADRGVAIAQHLGERLVVTGFSLGVLPAQKIAQTCAGVIGAILYHAAVPASVFGTIRPAHVPVQMHLNEDDPLAKEDLAAARELASQPGAELFLYPSRGHLVADPGSADYDQVFARQIRERTLAFLRQHTE